jgi:hypothetical protein
MLSTATVLKVPLNCEVRYFSATGCHIPTIDSSGFISTGRPVIPSTVTVEPGTLNSVRVAEALPVPTAFLQVNV